MLAQLSAPAALAVSVDPDRHSQVRAEEAGLLPRQRTGEDGEAQREAAASLWDPLRCLHRNRCHENESLPNFKVNNGD